jgi:hypothetical protein
MGAPEDIVSSADSASYVEEGLVACGSYSYCHSLPRKGTLSSGQAAATGIVVGKLAVIVPALRLPDCCDCRGTRSHFLYRTKAHSP